MDYGKMTKDELISEIMSLKPKLQDLENNISDGGQNTAVTVMNNVINSTPDMIFAKDTKLRTIMCNKAFADALGKKPEELIGKTDIENGWNPELVHGNPEKGIRGFVNDDRQALKGNEVHNPMDPANVGEVIRFFDTKKLPLRDLDGRVFGVLGIARDITEKKLAEDELNKYRNKLEEQVAERTKELTLTNKKLQLEIAERKKSEERLQAIIDNSTAVIYLKDINGQYIIINKLFETLFNISRKEVVGKTDFDVFPAKIAEAFQKNDRKVFECGNPIEFEEVASHADGLHTYISLKFPLSNTEGIIYGICGISTDITERRKMEKELIKIQKLESISIFAAGVAHDFNNSLQTILGYISLAGMPAKSNREIREYLEEARNAVLQSRDLTQQLLNFSMGGTPVKETISISELLEGSARLALSGSNVRYELIIPDGLWHIEADRGPLNQVISNLIINAIQAMPEGGNIKVLADNIDLVENNSLSLQEGRYVKISVKDHGTGILTEHMQKIFDPYFTTRRKGSGLGLAIAYSIIKKHDGHITVESETGVGATFHVYLPATQKNVSNESIQRKVDQLDKEHPGKKDTEKPAKSKGRILVMDDEHTIRTILCQLLRVLEYEVESVGEGTEAIRLYKSASETGKPFDVVIMDLTVPGGMGGKEAIKKLLKIDPEVKAIVSSGYVNDPIMTDHINHGFKGVLSKPHEVHELDEILQKVITMMK